MSSGIPFTSSLSHLSTRDLAGDAFRRGQAAARQAEAHDMNMKKSEFDLETQTMERPLRLHQLELDTDYKSRTQDARVRQQENQVTAQDLDNFKRLIRAMETGDMTQADYLAHTFFPVQADQFMEMAQNIFFSPSPSRSRKGSQ